MREVRDQIRGRFREFAGATAGGSNRIEGGTESGLGDATMGDATMGDAWAGGATTGDATTGHAGVSDAWASGGVSSGGVSSGAVSSGAGVAGAGETGPAVGNERVRGAGRHPSRCSNQRISPMKQLPEKQALSAVDLFFLKTDHFVSKGKKRFGIDYESNTDLRAAQPIPWRRAAAVRGLPSPALHSSIEEQLSDRGVTPQCSAHPVREAKRVLCDPQDSIVILTDRELWSMRIEVTSPERITDRRNSSRNFQPDHSSGIGHCKPQVIPPST